MSDISFKINDVVRFKFLGLHKEGTIIEVSKSENDKSKSMFKIRCNKTGIIYPHVGINNTEKFANIVVD